MPETGKRFEDKFARWLKELDIYFIRLFDARSVGGITAPQPADFVVCYKGRFILIELKHTDSTALPLSNISGNQLKNGLNALKQGIPYIFIVELRKCVISAKINDIIGFIKTEKRKSIPLKWFQDNCVELKNKREIIDYFQQLR